MCNEDFLSYHISYTNGLFIQRNFFYLFWGETFKGLMMMLEYVKRRIGEKNINITFLYSMFNIKICYCLFPITPKKHEKGREKKKISSKLLSLNPFVYSKSSIINLQTIINLISSSVDSSELSCFRKNCHRDTNI